MKYIIYVFAFIGFLSFITDNNKSSTLPKVISKVGTVMEGFLQIGYVSHILLFMVTLVTVTMVIRSFKQFP